MRHVDPPPPPRGWQTDVLKRGRSWLQQGQNRSSERPRDLWVDYLPQLRAAFDELCCYTAVWVPNGEADHFVPWGDVRGTRRAHLAYQWSNLRYADSWINRSKGRTPLPDPFVVQDDWFELELPSLELRATGRHPPALQGAVDALLQRVRDDDRVMRVRRRYLQQYRDGACSLLFLDRHIPLLGRALRRHPTMLHEGDR